MEEVGEETTSHNKAYFRGKKLTDVIEKESRRVEYVYPFLYLIHSKK